MASPTHIVVIGGGAGGLELAIRLARATRRGSSARVTLVDRRPTHLWKPRLHEIATGLLVPADEEVSYAAQGAEHGFRFVLGETSTIDTAAKRIVVAPVHFPDTRIAHGEDDVLLPERTLDYDIAVLAVGSTVNDFGTPGVREHCYTLDTVGGAEQLHRAVLALAARVAEEEASRIRVVVVGAGTTGVELAAELRSAARHLAQYRSLMRPDQLEVTIVEMADRPLAGTTAESSAYALRMLERNGVAMRFGAKVEAVRAAEVVLADASTLPADIVVWASGIRGPDMVRDIAGLTIDRGNRIRVDDRLRAIDTDARPIEGFFCIGDCAACYEPGADKPTPATAQAAHQQAALLARSLVGAIAGKSLLSFQYRYKGTLVSLGAGRAVGDVPLHGRRSLKVSGAGAKFAYDALYRSHLAIIYGWARTIGLVLAGFLRRQALPSAKLHW